MARFRPESPDPSAFSRYCEEVQDSARRARQPRTPGRRNAGDGDRWERSGVRTQMQAPRPRSAAPIYATIAPYQIAKPNAGRGTRFNGPTSLMRFGPF